MKLRRSRRDWPDLPRLVVDGVDLSKLTWFQRRRLRRLLGPWSNPDGFSGLADPNLHPDLLEAQIRQMFGRR